MTHASYSAHAPSISTCDSRMGGHAPIASSPLTNAKGWPARKSALPEHVNPISSFGIPDRSRASSTTGIRISTSFRSVSAREIDCANETIATSRTEQRLQHLLDGDVGLVDRLEVADALHVRPPLPRRSPLRLHPHAHPDLVGVDLLDQVRERDVGAVEEDPRGHVRDGNRS